MIDSDDDLSVRECITFAWWNTSLAPAGNSRACEELKRNAAEVIAYLIIESKVDFMALGELSAEDFQELQSLAVFSGYEFHDGVSKAGRSQFDTCYITNPAKITIHSLENITSARGDSVMKIAQRIDFSANNSGTIFHVFASHWPSRLWCEENHANRHILGIRLRDEIDELLKVNTTPPHIVLMGDYNDEPFDKSLSSHVMATRDIDLVLKRKHLFYNPYWSQMGRGKSGRSLNGGSYYYQRGETTHWYTFDQIIYSHAFVSAKVWRLADHNEHISDVPGLVELVTSTKSKFDHMPVYGTIEKVS
jgi:hypothetical protein